MMLGWMEALMEGHWRGEVGARDELPVDLPPWTLVLNGAK